MGRLAGAALLLWFFALTPSPGEAAGDPDKGKTFSETHCVRCHVVSEETRYAGINSTPSFFLLAGLDSYLDRFATFFDRLPHPSFTRMEGVEPWTELPPPIEPFAVTPEDVDDIIAYIEVLRSE